MGTFECSSLNGIEMLYQKLGSVPSFEYYRVWVDKSVQYLIGSYAPWKIHSIFESRGL
jgi:hypothetical protein